MRVAFGSLQLRLRTPRPADDRRRGVSALEHCLQRAQAVIILLELFEDREQSIRWDWSVPDDLFSQ